MRARLPAKLGAAVCLLLCAWFLAPLGMGIVHIGMLWPSALLVLAAARRMGDVYSEGVNLISRIESVIKR